MARYVYLSLNLIARRMSCPSELTRYGRQCLDQDSFRLDGDSAERRLRSLTAAAHEPDDP